MSIGYCEALGYVIDYDYADRYLQEYSLRVCSELSDKLVDVMVAANMDLAFDRFCEKQFNNNVHYADAAEIIKRWIRMYYAR